ncbi:MAG: hypothetical protein ACFB0E_20195 [Leptolyngbyaceae cyanobacterium]
MTETFQKLQSINDGDFEEPAIFFIRRRHREFAGLKATGVNEKGRSIAYPVDGIVHVPGDPSRCVALAATVTDIKDLRRKRLGGKNELGDIKKAAVKEFQKWIKEGPTLHCIL